MLQDARPVRRSRQADRRCQGCSSATRRQRAEETARDRWMLLFQLDIVELGDFELMFGDCGHIYFYITKEHLAARRFDRIWLILQCY